MRRTNRDGIFTKSRHGELVEGGVAVDLEHPFLTQAPDAQHRAAAAEAAGRVVEIILVGAEVHLHRAFDGFDHVQKGDLSRGPGQRIAPVRPANRSGELLAHQLLEDLGQKVLGHVHALRDLAKRNNRPDRLGRQVQHRSQAIFDAARDLERVLHRNNVSEAPGPCN